MFRNKNGVKQRNALSPLLFNFTLDYATRRDQGNQDGLKLKGTHQLLVYSDDINILGGSIHTIKKTQELLQSLTRRCVGLDVNAKEW